MAKAQVVKKVNKTKKTTLKENPIGKNAKLKVKCPSRIRKSKEFWKKNRRSHKGTKKEPRGVVYLSHIPHGFYDNQIEGYFKQFGQVTAVSVPKSKSGNAKGYAFVEFKHPEVAEIAAETMNNYLMFNRVVKAKYIPPAEQKPPLFRAAKRAKDEHMTLPERHERSVTHNRKVKNRVLKERLEVKLAAKLLRKSRKLKNTLSSVGVNCGLQVQRGNIDAVFKRKEERKLKKKSELQESTSEEESLFSEDEVELSSLEDDFSSVEDLRSTSEDKKKGSAKTVHKLGLNKNLKKKSEAKSLLLTSKIKSSKKKSSPESKLGVLKNSKTKKELRKGSKSPQNTQTSDKANPADMKQSKKVKKIKESALTPSVKKTKTLKTKNTINRSIQSGR